jgi:hypothetical protein
MTNSVQAAPYEILLRFNCEAGEVFGHLRGCHRVMATYLVDGNGVIAGRIETGAQAADFPDNELPKYLGDSFARFNAQLEETKVALSDVQLQHAAKSDEVKVLSGQVEHRDAVITERDARIAEQDARIAVLVRELRFNPDSTSRA